MKKKYTKPEIIFESFSMSTSIAGSCENIVNFARGVCGIPTNAPGIIVFVEGIGSMCTFFESNDIHDGLCYHIPIEENNLFNS